MPNIKFQKSLIETSNLCFSISPERGEFGDIIIDINDEEITIYTKYDHSHHETYIYNDIKDYLRRQIAIRSALNCINEIVNGKVVIEIEKKLDKTIKTCWYYKDTPNEKIRAMITFDREIDLLKCDNTIPSEIFTIDWNGLIKRETFSISDNQLDFNVNDKQIYCKRQILEKSDSYNNKLKNIWESLTNRFLKKII